MNRLRSNQLPVVQLRDALAPGLGALPDVELLERFARYADHPAFEVLLRRHGPMVLGVCRRTLLNSADADDAFQATFLVFLRKAKTVRGERLGPWLYGVAWRVSQKARTRAARLAARRTEGVEMLPAAGENAPIPDWLPVLDAELNALPAKYRDALVLCDLQGRSRAEAARELGLREGTLSSRLARGRELLRKRLLKHGTLLPAGGLAALFSASGVGRATVPASLLATVSELAKTGAAAGAVPVGAARLTDEVLRSMFRTKLRIAGGALVALVLATVGLAAALPRETPATEPEPVRAAKAPDKPAPVPQPVEKKTSGPKMPDREALQGLWVFEKWDAGAAKLTDDELREAKAMVGRTYILVAGDSWWGFSDQGDGHLIRQTAIIDPEKNPKWLDMLFDAWRGNPPKRHIYELDGDILRVCHVADETHARPAEFAADADARTVVTTFRRAKMPPAAGEKALVGSWAGEPITIKATTENHTWTHTPQAEVLDGHLFALVPHPYPGSHSPEWFGGKYTVDTTKNPKWVDLELAAPFGLSDEKVTKLYGSYEVADGRLKMVFGPKRATRPLEFKAAKGVYYLDLGPAKAEAPKAKLSTAPMPKVK